MAILNKNELAEIRREAAKGRVVRWDKSQINSALQAAEDTFESVRVQLSDAINTATSPFVFPNPIKKRIVAFWLKQKFKREGV